MMVLFFPAQQALDCLSDSGRILGKIEFDGVSDTYVFAPQDASVPLTDAEASSIAAKLANLSAGHASIAMQDDD
ncbi:hypothetical protein ACFQ45_06565 [Rhodanobacter aciditrophus]|uniref:Uncharacterized protein n=1 Tax=Rhodanobacter aciditrophus TaxID=1623218 RepID=A0ABW4B351_9GAMM